MWKVVKPPLLLFTLPSETWRHREKCRFGILHLLAGPDDGDEDPGDEEDDEGAAKHAFKNSFFKKKIYVFVEMNVVNWKVVLPPQAVKSHLVWKAKTVRARVTPALFKKNRSFIFYFFSAINVRNDVFSPTRFPPRWGQSRRGETRSQSPGVSKND